MQANGWKFSFSFIHSTITRCGDVGIFSVWSDCQKRVFRSDIVGVSQAADCVAWWQLHLFISVKKKKKECWSRVLFFFKDEATFLLLLPQTRTKQKQSFTFWLFLQTPLLFLCSVLYIICPSILGNGLLHGALVQIVCADVQPSYLRRTRWIAGRSNLFLLVFTPAYSPHWHFIFTRFKRFFFLFVFIFIVFVQASPCIGETIPVNFGFNWTCLQEGDDRKKKDECFHEEKVCYDG